MLYIPPQQSILPYYLCSSHQFDVSHPYPYCLGCAFRFLFRFPSGLIFWNLFFFPAESAEFHGTHIGIKSFQGKINLFRNPTESGIQAGILEGRKDL